MIEESYVSFDTAKMLKEAGFDVPGRGVYVTDRTGYYEFREYDNKQTTDDLCWDTEDGFQYEYLAPTQALAARWLREAYGIHVVITEEAYTNGINYLWQVLIYNPLSVDCWDNKSTGMYGDNGEYKTYEEALEAGLQEAIKLIKKQ